MAEKGLFQRLYVLLVLLAVCIHNLSVRHLPSYLIVVPVPTCEFCLNCSHCGDASFFNLADGTHLQTWQYGFLMGFGLFAGAVPVGLLKPRISVITGALLVSSAGTLLQASAHSFRFLLGCRCVQGFAQAFALPALGSTLLDLFPEAAAVVLSIGLCLGMGCASLSIWVAALAGWRWAVLLSGLAGLFLSAMLLTLSEPLLRRGNDSAFSLKAVFDVIGSTQARIPRLLVTAAGCKFVSAYCLSAYMPLWYARAALPGYDSTSYAGWNALVVASGGLFSMALGLFGHRWSRDARAPCWIGLGSAVCSLPLIVFVLGAPSFWVSMVCLFLLILLGECWFVPTMALLQASVRSSGAVSVLVVASLTANFGPALVGVLDPGNDRIKFHLIWVTLLANQGAAIAFWAAAREIGLDPVAVALTDDAERMSVAFHDQSLARCQLTR